MTSKLMRRWAMGAAMIAAFLAAAAGPRRASAADPAPAKDTSLFPNDFGEAEIDVSEYPKPQREAYKLMQFKCAACHTTARPINAQYLELTAEEAAKAKKEDPELAAADDKVTHIEDKVWARFVKRMMAKPGCPVNNEDGKKIYEFLVFDAKIRKMGEKGKEFRKARAHLVHEFKEHHPDAYAKLFGDAAAPKTGK